MRKKWKYILLAVVIIVLGILLAGIKTGTGTQKGNFHFIREDESGKEFMYVPE